MCDLMVDAHKKTVVHGFLLLETFSMMALTAVMDPFRIANRLSGRKLFDLVLLSGDSSIVEANNGMRISTAGSIYKWFPSSDSRLFILGPNDPFPYDDKKINHRLQQLASKGISLCGVDSGSYVMAQSGLLDGFRSTIHWEFLPGYRELFPRSTVSNELYEVDGLRSSCAGGTAGIDMALHFIRVGYGSTLANEVSDSLIHGTARDHSVPQRMDTQFRLGVSDATLLDCIELMEANVEQPLQKSELAQVLTVSTRHLERLFRTHLKTTPSRYYLEIRLRKSHQLLQQTRMSITDISTACGFKNGSHFSKTYKYYFKQSPRDVRSPLSNDD